MKTYTKATELKAEIARLKSEYEAELAKLRKELEWMHKENERKDDLISNYIAQIKLAQHRRFGSPCERSEIPEQLGLFNEPEVHAEIDVESVQTETVTYKRKKRKGKRREFYENLPVRQEVHELGAEEQVCSICGGDLHECGREVVRSEVEHIPASVTKVEHVEVVYGCRGCEKNPDMQTRTVVKPGVPAPVIPNSGIASPSLVSYVISNKYVLALPLNRQSEEFKRLGIEIPKQNLANWVIYASRVWLAIIWEMLKEELLTNEVIHGDESTHHVICEDGRKAKQKSYMWGYFTGRDSPRQVVLFEYQETRAGRHPLNFLEGWSGKLHVDAYAGYHKLEAQGVTLSYCWSHVRRKYFEALKSLPNDKRNNSLASVGLRYCDQLFALERYYNDECFSCEQRERWRELLSIPMAEEFFAWAESVYDGNSRDKMLGKAVSYMLNGRRRLMNAFNDGRLEISNNRAERGFIEYAIGRNNWKFSYSPKGAKASAVAYSLVETAQANGLVPYLYLKFLFETLPNIPKERYCECLPWHPTVKQLCAIPVKEMPSA